MIMGRISRQMDRFQFMGTKLLADMSYVNIFQDTLKKPCFIFFPENIFIPIKLYSQMYRWSHQAVT